MLSDVLTSAEGTTSANFVKKSFSEIQSEGGCVDVRVDVDRRHFTRWLYGGNDETEEFCELNT